MKVGKVEKFDSGFGAGVGPHQTQNIYKNPVLSWRSNLNTARFLVRWRVPSFCNMHNHALHNVVAVLDTKKGLYATQNSTWSWQSSQQFKTP